MRRSKPSGMHVPRRSFVHCAARGLAALACVAVVPQLCGCVSDSVREREEISPYQHALVERGPQARGGTRGVSSFVPSPNVRLPELVVAKDKSGNVQEIKLSLDEAVLRALANSPEMTVTSFDPAIAKEDVTRSVGQFDLTTYGRVNYEDNDNPTDSLFSGGRSTGRVMESGVKQKTVTGAEWSLAYTIARNWDNLLTHSLATKYEPMVVFQIRQPLLRDAWWNATLGDVDVAKLNYEIALAAFRQRTEELASEVIANYWLLLQARRDLEIQSWLIEQTRETLQKLKDRHDIDATTVQVKQAEASMKVREAAFYQDQKRLIDIQNALIRLLSDDQITLLGNARIVPASEPSFGGTALDVKHLLDVGMEKNPVLEQARIAVQVAERNAEVAWWQRLPRIDLVGSTGVRGLAKASHKAHDMLDDSDYQSYAVGIVFEYPLGNRERGAEKRRRDLEASKASAALQNLSDQVATATSESVRQAETAYLEISLQREAVNAARFHLQALADTEAIRDKLTPEFLLVKLQAQESLATAQRSEIKAVVDYNIALTRLAQVTGTVLDLKQVRAALPVATEGTPAPRAAGATAAPVPSTPAQPAGPEVK